MPGLVSPLSAASDGVGAGMKRAHAPDAVPTYGEPHPKKRKVVHQLRYTQPLHHIVEPIAGGFGATGDTEFFDHQLRRAIAIECKGIGFDGTAPAALEMFKGLVDEYMMHFLQKVRQSMVSARRTETVPHDWIQALVADGIRGSSLIEPHLDTGEIPKSLLQPFFAPPEPAEPPPPDLEGLLGPELSGKAEKESKAYIPKHFPPFPSKHTYKSTPVFAERENDPRRIREKAAEEGIEAEKSLRKLMIEQKKGLQNKKGGKRKLSARMKEDYAMWQTAMQDSLQDDEARVEKWKRHRALRRRADLGDGWEDAEVAALPARPEQRLNLEEGVHVNYDQKFHRAAGRGG
ncbi:hypothetical protein K458DRAFT_416440 [Lentithecium fluviatile CBS 122367]|uniref:Transcription initiation factor TFIID subunit 8 n=1 Tax=Lentithecium fluviatile CBS 122367 TaxID=1168545 RepID=A0A6G1J7D6_9PLEO|nr:hypothetical protein K458DRAFT_416440 [Lentithecium fluviatile CBS 122367]